MRDRSVVLGRYSVLKVLVWIVIVAGVCIWILHEGYKDGWTGTSSSRPGLALLAYGAAPFGLLGVGALCAILIARRGVAIELHRGSIALNFPFGRKMIALDDGLSVSATTYSRAMPSSLLAIKIGDGRFVQSQLTFSRRGEPDINFPIGLLSEDASAIAERTNRALQGRSSTVA